MGIVSLEEKEEPSNIAELGIWIHPEFHGNGYGTEAVELVIEHGLEQLNYYKLYARAHAENEASQRIWEKHGFEKEGLLREHVFVKGEHRDLLYYGLLRGEYE
jgi:ribosomal-protein-alanine N-acetyltransferase